MKLVLTKAKYLRIRLKQRLRLVSIILEWDSVTEHKKYETPERSLLNPSQPFQSYLK